MENIIDYSRQSELDETMHEFPKDEINVIIGCGGIGFWLGLQLAMLGYRNFILIEGDKIDYSNLNRLPVPPSWVGINKAVALRKMIRTMRYETIVLTLNSHISKDTLSLLERLAQRCRTYSNNRDYLSVNTVTIWDTTDDARTQAEIYKYVQTQQHMHYRKIGYEGFKIGNYSEYAVWTGENYQTGYRTSNANAVTSCMSAGIGIFSRALTTKDVELNLKDLIKYSTKPTKPISVVEDEIKEFFKKYDNNDDFTDRDILNALEKLKETLLKEGVLNG